MLPILEEKSVVEDYVNAGVKKSELYLRDLAERIAALKKKTKKNLVLKRHIYIENTMKLNKLHVV